MCVFVTCQIHPWLQNLVCLYVEKKINYLRQCCCFVTCLGLKVNMNMNPQESKPWPDDGSVVTCVTHKMLKCEVRLQSPPRRERFFMFSRLVVCGVVVIICSWLCSPCRYVCIFGEMTMLKVRAIHKAPQFTPNLRLTVVLLIIKQEVQQNKYISLSKSAYGNIFNETNVCLMG